MSSIDDIIRQCQQERERRCNEPFGVAIGAPDPILDSAGKPTGEYRQMVKVNGPDVARKPDSRRLCIYPLDPQFLVDMFRQFQRHEYISVPALPALPQDARVVDVHYSERSRCLCVVVESDSFPEIPPGMEIPTVDQYGFVVWHRAEGFKRCASSGL